MFSHKLTWFALRVQLLSQKYFKTWLNFSTWRNWRWTYEKWNFNILTSGLRKMYFEIFTVMLFSPLFIWMTMNSSTKTWRNCSIKRHSHVNAKCFYYFLFTLFCILWRLKILFFLWFHSIHHLLYSMRNRLSL